MLYEEYKLKKGEISLCNYMVQYWYWVASHSSIMILQDFCKTIESHMFFLPLDLAATSLKTSL